jgi:hypothetical protein
MACCAGENLILHIMGCNENILTFKCVFGNVNGVLCCLPFLSCWCWFQCGVYWTCVSHVAGWGLCLLGLSLLLLMSFLRDVIHLGTALWTPGQRVNTAQVQTEEVAEEEVEEWLDSADSEDEDPLRGEVIREVAGLISQIVVDTAVESAVKSAFRRSRRAVWKGPRGESSIRGGGPNARQARAAAAAAAESSRRFLKRLATVEEEESSDADADPEWKLQTITLPLSPGGATDDSENEQEPTDETLTRERLIASFPSESMCAKARRLICPCVFRTERERAVTACRGCVRTSCGVMHLCRIRRRTYYEIYEDDETE